MSTNCRRNEIPKTNSASKCLVENWTEERAVSHIDPKPVFAAVQFKYGHSGLLSINPDTNFVKTTTVNDSYKTPAVLDDQFRPVGSKKQVLEKMLIEQISKEMEEEAKAKEPEPTKYYSTMQMDYFKEFNSAKPPPTQHHDLIKEQPVTFWSEHKERLHGVSQQKILDGPFKKNAAFSTPIEHSMETSKPHEPDRYPNM